MRAAWWWIDRWRKSTAYTDMRLSEQAAYRNLLDELWLRGGALPDDDRILGKICGDSSEWPSVRKVVMARFHLTPEGWRNVTHDEVATQSQAFQERQREKGRKRAESANRVGGKFEPVGNTTPAGNQPNHQPNHQPRAPAGNQPSVSVSVSVSVSCLCLRLRLARKERLTAGGKNTVRSSRTASPCGLRSHPKPAHFCPHRRSQHGTG